MNTIKTIIIIIILILNGICAYSMRQFIFYKKAYEKCTENSVYEAEQHLKDLNAERKNGAQDFYYKCLKTHNPSICNKIK